MFLQSAGDDYQTRNSIAQANSTVVASLAGYLSPGATVLEIGCGADQNLVALEQLVPGIRCVGVDPSTSAIAAAKLRLPSHRFIVGSADDFAIEDCFDMVFFGFCLYVCDRPLLYAAVTRADSALKGASSGEVGVFAIHDFDPVSPHRRAYSHHADVTTYKMDYSALFLANPGYRLATKVSFGSSGNQSPSAADSNNRTALWVLEKDFSSAYPLRD